MLTSRAVSELSGDQLSDQRRGHQYHSLTVEVERRYSTDFPIRSSCGRDIADLDRGAYLKMLTTASGTRRGWHSRIGTGNVIYELPFGKGKRWLGRRVAWSVRWWWTSAASSLSPAVPYSNAPSDRHSLHHQPHTGE
jgi:hypothetical protein